MFRTFLTFLTFLTFRSGATSRVSTRPLSARRFVQKAEGYVATLVSGVPILRHDQPTGERPGRLLRSGRFAT